MSKTLNVRRENKYGESFILWGDRDNDTEYSGIIACTTHTCSNCAGQVNIGIETDNKSGELGRMIVAQLSEEETAAFIEDLKTALADLKRLKKAAQKLVN